MSGFRSAVYRRTSNFLGSIFGLILKRSTVVSSTVSAPTARRSLDGSIMAARLAREVTLRVAARDVVVKGPFREEFDVSPDGSRFLVIEGDAANRTLVVIPNWITELRRATAAAR